MRKFKIVLIIICLFGLLFLVINLPKKINKKENAKLYINEIVADNESIIENNNEYYDYIEIYNNTNKPINLDGYFLSDNIDNLEKWEFSDTLIDAKSYLLVFASGKDYCADFCHTNFKLSSDEETVVLSDSHGNIISKVHFKNLGRDISYGLIDNEYKIMNEATPGYKNTNITFIKSNLTSDDIEISEYITHNTRVNYDSHGNYYDWVEIHNISDSSITLENVYITDDENKLNKFKIPKRVLEKDDYLLIYFSGEKEDYTDNIYAPFNIGDNDKYIILSDGEDIITWLDIVKLKDNMSYGKVEDSYKYFTTPTPGKKNNTAYYDLVIE